MKAKTYDKKSALIKQYHTVCHINGLKQTEKDAILLAYGVESSKDLTEQQLTEIISRLSDDANHWRKRLIAAVGAWLRKINKAEDINIIKGIACRATGYYEFNKIPVSSLRNIYYEFVRKANTKESVDTIKMDIIKNLELQN